MARTNSNPILLNTIKMPRDMLRLKAILPEKRQKNAHVSKFKSDLSELLNNDHSFKDESNNIKGIQSSQEMPAIDQNKNQRKDRSDIILNNKNKNINNEHSEHSIYNSLNGNGNNNQINLVNNNIKLKENVIQSPIKNRNP